MSAMSEKCKCGHSEKRELILKDAAMAKEMDVISDLMKEAAEKSLPLAEWGTRIYKMPPGIERDKELCNYKYEAAKNLMNPMVFIYWLEENEEQIEKVRQVVRQSERAFGVDWAQKESLFEFIKRKMR